MTTNNFTPEEEHKILSWQKSQKRGKIMGGLIVVTFGILYLLKVLGIETPEWIFTLPVFLIAAGLVVLVKHKFKKLLGWVLVLVGKFLLLSEFYPDLVNSKLIWPILIILFGLKIIFKPKNALDCSRRGRHNRFKRKGEFFQNIQDLENVTDNDFVDSASFFGGVNKNVVSKNFKGADLLTIFGGTEINLLQAELEQKAIIDLTCIFGGVTLIIPPHWQVQSEVITAFGGFEDKRQMNTTVELDNKILVLKGLCVFGGVEIKSFK